MTDEGNGQPSEAGGRSYWPKKSRSMMKWAVDAHTRRPVYVSSLPREKTGLQCGCVCPHCGTVLQAVNAGVPPQEIEKDKGLDQHFRHHRAQQQDRCKLAVAERAALELLLSRGVIELPAPKVPGSVAGRSGAVYSHTAEGTAATLQIASFQRLDETAAELVLEDGRRIAVLLKGSRAIDENGDWCAVVEIQVDDPEVALWAPERILADARLVGAWMCVKKHWQDAELAEKARAQATAKAHAALDDLEAELDLPSWVPPKLRSECLLHWKIKTILAEARHISMAAYSEPVTLVMPNGRTESKWVSLPSTRLEISDVGYEVPMVGFKPDICCRAVDPVGPLGSFDLIIEVAVTHRVDESKLQRIRERGVACIEIYSERLARGGVVTVDELRQLVLDDPNCKQWLHHELLEGQRRRARQALDQVSVAMTARNRLIEQERKRAEQEAIREQQKRLAEANARHDAFARLSDEEAAHEVLHALRCRWQLLPMRSGTGTAWEGDELELALSARGLDDLMDPALVEEFGPLWLLSSIKGAMRRPNGRSLTYSDLGLLRMDWRWRHLVLAAIQVYQPLMSQEDARQFDADLAHVDESIRQGSLEYVRPTKHDEALGLYFPELREILDDVVGTPGYAQERRLEVAKQREEAAQEAQRQEELARVEHEAAEAAKRQQEQEQAAVAREELRKQRLLDAIDILSHQFTWRDTVKAPRDAAGAMKFASIILRSVDGATAEAIRSAYQAREAGLSLRQWLEDQAPPNAEQVMELGRIAEAAWLAEAKVKPTTPTKRR